MSQWVKTKNTGVQMRHQNECRALSGGKCRCQKSFRARYKNAGGDWRWSKSVHDENEALSIRAHGDSKLTSEAQESKPAARLVFNDLADQWYELAKCGAIGQKGGRPYSAGTLNTYKRMYDNHVRPELGTKDAHVLTALDWQHWLDALARKGLKKNSITPTLNMVRSVYRYACAPTRMILVLNATRGLELPANDETPRDRVATPAEARELLSAVSGCDRTAYGLALYAGMRNMERRPLDWTDIDFKAARLRVRVSKTEKGIRGLPITAPLRMILREEWLRQGRPLTGLVVRGPKGGAPEYDSQVARAKKAWTQAGMKPIGFHECRHTFISTMIESGLNMKAVSVLAGHASIQVTADRYGHLFPGHEDEAGRKLDALYVQPASDLSNGVTNERPGESQSTL